MGSNKVLQQRLAYEFSDAKLLKAALTHRSIRGINNERMEFLGDSLVNFFIAEELYLRKPNANEGELSRLRASLVKGETLTEIAREFDLGSHLLLGVGELKSGGRLRDSILADAVEAIIAGIYLDSDIAICRQCVLAWYQTRLDNLAADSGDKDAKTQLQEYLQARHLDLPKYEVTDTQGEAHEQIFTIECRVVDLDLIEQGIDTTRRRAEQKAAGIILNNLFEAEKK